jgi:DNA polymerase III subunit beta
MKTNRKQLLAALETAAATADRKSTMPVLGSVLLRASAGTLTVSASRLSQDVAQAFLCDGELDVCVQAHDVVARVRELVGDEIELTETGGVLTLRATGKRRFTLHALPGSDFPAVRVAPADGWLTVPGDVLRELISRAERCICDDDSRRSLNALLLSGCRVVSTNGHALAYAESDSELPSALVPQRAVVALRRLDGEQIELAVADGRLFARCDGLTFSTQLVDDAFPPYEQILPQDDRVLTAPAAELLAAVRAVAVAVPDDKGLVATFGPDTLQLRAASGESADEVPVTWTTKPRALEIGFSPRLLVNALTGLHGSGTVEIVIQSSDDLSPIVIRAARSVQVVMPMRV